MLKYIFKIGDWYYFRRRVPSYVAHLDKRKEVKIALKTKELNAALSKAHIYNEHIDAFWRSLIKTGKPDEANSKYKSAVKLAKAYGFAYKTSYELAEAPLEEVINRVAETGLDTPEIMEAVIGGVDRPTLKLSDCEKQYWDLTVDRLVNKTPFKISKWKNPRRAAFLSFIEVVGDKYLADITKTDVLAFKNMWRPKIVNGHSPSTANKQLQQIKDILQTTAFHNEVDIDIDLIFSKAKFKSEIISRPAFDAKYVQDVLLQSLGQLNERDRLVVFALADTGARPSEIFGLTEDEIFLDTDIPFIWIKPREGYSLKTSTSERQIPLVGAALDAFRQSPKGFLQRGNPDVFSTRTNKFLTEHALRPTPQHSIYSLRHTFKDRLRDIEAPEEIIHNLMGHQVSGPKYGRGHKLETKFKWLNKIAYRIP
ncbi:MAG: hypothetical protein JNK00_00340 [Flavipsychrobacter sp.]|nr:hypothetical protein [Flavipsychrobacter sp.]